MSPTRNVRKGAYGRMNSAQDTGGGQQRFRAGAHHVQGIQRVLTPPSPGSSSGRGVPAAGAPALESCGLSPQRPEHPPNRLQGRGLWPESCLPAWANSPTVSDQTRRPHGSLSLSCFQLWAIVTTRLAPEKTSSGQFTPPS